MSTLDPAHVAQSLGNARREGRRWRARCPVCQKHTFTIGLSDDGQTYLVRCWSGCSQQQVVEALRRQNLWPAPPSRNGHAPATPAPALSTPAGPGSTNGHRPGEAPAPIDPLAWLADYCGVARATIVALPVRARGGWVAFEYPTGAQKLRKAGSKDIRWGLPTGTSRPALWPLSSPSEPLPEHIYLLESETDAIVARHLGLAAFAVTAGASTALKPHEAEALRRRGVRRATLLYDIDAAGKEGAAKQAEALHGAGIEVTIVDLAAAGLVDPLCGGKDVRDCWLAARARNVPPEAVRQALEAAVQPWTPAEGEAEAEAEAGGEAWTKRRCSSLTKMITPSGMSIFGVDEHLRSKCSTPRLAPLAGVRPQPVRWLWPGRVPLGKLTILDGDPGLGKSLLTLDLVARVSTGREMPDGSRGDLEGPAGVVLLSAEDDPADTIRPRLDVAGGDPARVAVLQAVDEVEVADDGGERRRERGVTLADIEPLRQAIQETGARLVVIDPVMAHVGKADSHRDAEVRGLLRPLAELAQETGAAILIVRHLNKSAGGNPLYRGGGSIAWIGAARSGLLVAPDPDDETGQRKVLAVTKSNLAQPAPALAYTIEAVVHEGAGFVPRVCWHGESAHTARSLLAQPTEDGERSALEEAKAFLLDLLGAGPVEADRVHREARAAGIADVTLRRAKALLGVRSAKTTWGGCWQWALPESRTNAPKMLIDAEDAHPLRDEHLRGHEHLRSKWSSPSGADSAAGADADDLPFESAGAEAEAEARAEAGIEGWPPLDDEADEAAPVRPDGPCPRCGYQLVRRTCWKCRDSLCSDCGAWTGSGLRTRCLPCGIKAHQRERWGDGAETGPGGTR